MKCQKCKKYIGFGTIITKAKNKNNVGKIACLDCHKKFQTKEK